MNEGEIFERSSSAEAPVAATVPEGFHSSGLP